MENNTEKIIRRILVSIVKGEEKKDKVVDCDDLNILEDLEFDSLDIMDYIVKISDEFDIIIEDHEEFIENLYELKKLVSWIDNNVR